MSTNKHFTLILNQAKNGERKVLDRAPEGFKGVDLGRLKASYPAIAESVTRTGVKVTVRAKVNETTGENFLSQHPNECVEYQCTMGMGLIRHKMKPKSQMNQPGPASVMDLDHTRVNEETGEPDRCTNLVMVAKGDEHLRAPLCEACSGTGEKKGGSKLPTDVLAALGLDIDEV